MITKVFVDMREGRCYFNYTVEGGRKESILWQHKVDRHREGIGS